MGVRAEEIRRAARERMRRVSELYDQGFEWPTIARQTGYSSAPVAKNAFAKYKDRHGPPPWPKLEEER